MIQQFVEQRGDVRAVTTPPATRLGSPDMEEWLRSQEPSDVAQDAGDKTQQPTKIRLDEVQRAQVASGSSVGGKLKKEELQSAVEEARMKQEQQRKEWHAALEASKNDGDSPAARHYRVWAIEVLQPLNERALEILIKRADLMDTTAVPPIFRQFAAHVLAFRTVVARWNSGDFSQRRCPIRYPEAFGPYVAYEFRRLKMKQAQQLNSLSTLQKGGTFLQWTGLTSVEMKDSSERPIEKASGQMTNKRLSDHLYWTSSSYRTPSSPPQSRL
eukprot:gnl/MRDRNA2_/MRDRNA2_63926_c0_seq1.p1 gnl/MRDRNA2_/MRDRNA2_63926_c0~~gnl/MRDRNA2_/MRDRNA2_63926_c0_seq1.p1  ORF type:complete len:271 (+),score=69.22 gnl/MRDRNA2_/MRDRNA2_63926_c0_seq1:147-959(+)